MFINKRADEVRMGDYVSPYGKVKEVEHYGCNVELVFPASPDCRLIRYVTQHIRGDLPVKVLAE